MRQQPAPRTEPSRAEIPRAEPEIIPPGADYPSAPHFERASYTHARHATRIRVARVGPVGFVLLLVLAGVLAVAGSVVLLAAALIGAAAAGMIIAGATVSRLVRGLFRQ
jgi:hypothetical protein